MRRTILVVVAFLAACGQGTNVTPEAQPRAIDTTAPRFLPHVACARWWDEDPFGTHDDPGVDREAFLAECVTDPVLLDQLRDHYGSTGG